MQWKHQSHLEGILAGLHLPVLGTSSSQSSEWRFTPCLAKGIISHALNACMQLNNKQKKTEDKQGQVKRVIPWFLFFPQVQIYHFLHILFSWHGASSYQIASMLARVSTHKNFEVLKKFFSSPETFTWLVSQKIKLIKNKIGIFTLQKTISERSIHAAILELFLDSGHNNHKVGCKLQLCLDAVLDRYPSTHMSTPSFWFLKEKNQVCEPEGSLFALWCFRRCHTAFF